ncbi:MAG: PQQ-dependent sugar dehydrogenase [Labilithrix sp.]|nr:PQQ-dependent sugar dehydrogenase [Labilithrix sp.]MCW5810222.1 PQQ-dependent sugar dehydrogenase [Labilithrix sp.]
MCREVLLSLVLVSACTSADNAPSQPDGGSVASSTSSSGTVASSSSGDPAGVVDSGADVVRPSGAPVETNPPNAPSQTPAFPGQTRAPGHATNVAFDVRVVASGLGVPWAVAFLPDGAKLVTSRAGQMRIVSASGEVSSPLAGVPAVAANGQGGLLDVVVDPAFAQTSLVYFTYSEPRTGGSGTAVARARLAGGSLADVQVIWRMPETRNSSQHFGARLVFARDGSLFVATGERAVGDGSGNARDLASSYGKVIRVRPDGAIPEDNPLVGRAGALPEVFAAGLRNPQAAALNPWTGELWTVEHGPRGGDEVNVIRAGKDYGWPTVTYGINYNGSPVGEGVTSRAGIEQPLYYWDPVIAPAGAAFYDAEAFPAWRGSLFIGSLAQRHLVRLTLEGERIIGEERLLVERAGRVRDVRVGPTGTIFVTDESAGELLELVPR